MEMTDAGGGALVDGDRAAARLGTNKRRLRELVSSGDLPAVRLGPRVTRFAPEALDEFVRRGGVGQRGASGQKE